MELFRKAVSGIRASSSVWFGLVWGKVLSQPKTTIGRRCGKVIAETKELAEVVIVVITCFLLMKETTQIIANICQTLSA